jgi:hypothetical protein
MEARKRYSHVEQHKSKIRAVIEQRQAATRAAIKRTRREIQEELELRVEGYPPLRLSGSYPCTRKELSAAWSERDDAVERASIHTNDLEQLSRLLSEQGKYEEAEEIY